MSTKTKKNEKQQTAAETYAARKADIASLLDLIQQEIEANAAEAAKDLGNWGYAGSLGHVRSELKNILSFLVLKDGQSEEAVDRMIEKHLDEMRDE